ncbi:hydrolase, partial [Streptomyces fuscigenes]|nr:hydrolase [Streptomyces fuscigenes]
MPDRQPQPSGGSPAGTTALILSGARLADGRTVDVRLGGSRIEAVAPAGSLGGRMSRIDLGGHLLLPAPAEPHAHSDTALSAEDPPGGAPATKPPAGPGSGAG